MTFARPINTKGQPPRITGPFNAKSHPGIDYGYVEGTPVHASQAGRVVIAKGDEHRQWIANTKSDPFRPASGTRRLRTEDYGNFIKIDHGGGYATLYAHLKKDSLLVKVGDTVKIGQQIARVGSTGNSSGNHLHWEVREDDATIDPSTRFNATFSHYTTGEVIPPVKNDDALSACMKDREQFWKERDEARLERDQARLERNSIEQDLNREREKNRELEKRVSDLEEQLERASREAPAVPTEERTDSGSTSEDLTSISAGALFSELLRRIVPLLDRVFPRG